MPKPKLAGLRAQRGFTLVELLVTLTIATILMMIAVPSFKNLTLSNRLTTSANDIVHAINVARMEAIKRNASTQLCSNSSSANSSSDLGAACGDETGAVWATKGGNVTQVLAGTPNLTAPLQLTGNAAALRFDAQGLARKVGDTSLYVGTVVDICTSQMSTNNHRKISMVAGSIVETKPSSGSCP
ncbi:GspH/FimT family pseudopilin [Rhodanobacter sp. AS-Z3]|uniref:GspH/FimT family pseudopilin n=1 Tax=Rhodanobacter sp. AS-Z3 TaxID=3031330 RepID=UPI0024783864|nr:GspH/FimT family pseudopilin [Rhodanobacter sp. AS-Z3]WEN16849.1 GspH/FimT family pseudopilin [Rhodanobacter sp. AS-Z3]